MPVALDWERLADLLVIFGKLLESRYLADELLDFKTLGTLYKYIQLIITVVKLMINGDLHFCSR